MALKSLKKKQSGDTVESVVAFVQEEMRTNKGTYNRQLGSSLLALATESADFTPNDRIQCENNLNAAFEQFRVVLDNIGATISKNNKSTDIMFNEAQMNAAVSSLAFEDIENYIQTPYFKKTDDSTVYNMQSLPSASVNRSVAFEEYDQTKIEINRDLTVTYNLFAARQDEVGELMFPTVTVTPDENGYRILLRLINVQDEVKRDLNGKKADYKRYSLIHAAINGDVLRDVSTDIVPIVKVGAEDKFVDPTLVPNIDYLIKGEVFKTRPYAFGVETDILGLSLAGATLSSGTGDHTDAVNPSVKLHNLYLKITDGTDNEVLRFDVRNLPRSNFVQDFEGNTRNIRLNFETAGLVINKNVKKLDGSNSTLLAPIVTGSFSVYIGVKVNGTINTAEGATQIYQTPLEVKGIYDSTGKELASTDSNYITIKDLFDGAEFFGYDLVARKTNTNLREIGKLLEVSEKRYAVFTNIGAPLSVVRPLNSQNGEIDGTLVTGLLHATRIKTSNAAIDKLWEIADTLDAYVNNNTVAANTAQLGISFELVRKPYYKRETFKLRESLNTLKSSDRLNDVQAAFANKIRDIAGEMIMETGVNVAADLLFGGNAPKPTVKIATDQRIAQYLFTNADTRYLGEKFDCLIGVSVNEKMYNKIVITVSYGGQENTPNPLNLGNMVYQPEAVIEVPADQRNGAISRRVSVHPHFDHTFNLPIMAVLDVEELSEGISGNIPLINKPI